MISCRPGRFPRRELVLLLQADDPSFPVVFLLIYQVFVMGYTGCIIHEHRQYNSTKDDAVASIPEVCR